jgi:hypothetical protein
VVALIIPPVMVKINPALLILFDNVFVCHGQSCYQGAIKDQGNSEVASRYLTYLKDIFLSNQPDHIYSFLIHFKVKATILVKGKRIGSQKPGISVNLIYRYKTTFITR